MDLDIGPTIQGSHPGLQHSVKPNPAARVEESAFCEALATTRLGQEAYCWTSRVSSTEEDVERRREALRVRVTVYRVQAVGHANYVAAVREGFCRQVCRPGERVRCHLLLKVIGLYVGEAGRHEIGQVCQYDMPCT